MYGMIYTCAQIHIHTQIGALCSSESLTAQYNTRNQIFVHTVVPQLYLFADGRFPWITNNISAENGIAKISADHLWKRYPFKTELVDMELRSSVVVWSSVECRWKRA